MGLNPDGSVDADTGASTDGVSTSGDRPRSDGGLTSDDVVNFPLKHGMRGYVISQVDELLDSVADELDRLHAQVANLQAALAEARSEVNRRADAEGELRRVLLRAETAAEEAMALAQEEADAVVKGARLQAEQILEAARDQARRERDEVLAELDAQEARFRVRKRELITTVEDLQEFEAESRRLLRGLLEDQLSRLDGPQLVDDIDATLRPARRRLAGEGMTSGSDDHGDADAGRAVPDDDAVPDGDATFATAGESHGPDGASSDVAVADGAPEDDSTSHADAHLHADTSGEDPTPEVPEAARRDDREATTIVDSVEWHTGDLATTPAGPDTVSQVPTHGADATHTWTPTAEAASSLDVLGAWLMENEGVDEATQASSQPVGYARTRRAATERGPRLVLEDDDDVVLLGDDPASADVGATEVHDDHASTLDATPPDGVDAADVATADGAEVARRRRRSAG